MHTWVKPVAGALPIINLAPHCNSNSFSTAYSDCMESCRELER